MLDSGGLLPASLRDTQRSLPWLCFLRPHPAMFLLLSLLAALGGLLASLDSEGMFLYVTVPQKIRSNESEDWEKQVTYIITIDKKPYTLHLRKHTFVSQNFLVYTHNETGSLHSESSYFKMQCHYQGYIADFPNSVVTLSICSGLRGFIQFENISYGIEPLESSARFEHIIYQVKNDHPDKPMFAENYSNIWQKDQSYTIHLSSQEKTFSELLPQYLEMHIIVEKALYDYMGSEMMAVTQKIIQIIGLVNAMFSQFKLTVILSSLELWSDKNQISTIGDADDLLQRFLAWKQDYLILRPHDVTFLLIYREQPKYVGATFPGTVCNRSYDSDVAVYPGTITLEAFSVIIAQLLGLKIGLAYDDIQECPCPTAKCIMNHEAIVSSGVKTFSSCSMHEYSYFVSTFEAQCLQKFSILKPFYQNQSVCGNGILEMHEECDCGSEEECQFKNCCDYNTCKLKGLVECASGSCCTSKCEISVAGTPCRKSVDPECDFTEYCNGTSSDCVPDTYAMNGQLCRSGTAYCYNGQCQITDEQCAKVFGKGAQGAPFACFEEVNSLHNSFGNCGFENSQPLPCEQKDVLCGKLACVWPQNSTYRSDVRSAVYSYSQGLVCITPASSVRSGGGDDTYVADGTMCGEQMYCVNKTCKEVSLMGYNCNATIKCRGNGICNNLGNCHCIPDYAPPDCELHIGSPGGSIDDGNLKLHTMSIKKNYSAHQNWLILCFYIFLPFFIIFAIRIMKRNKMRKSCNKESVEHEGSFLDSHFLVYSYSKSGMLLSDSSFIQDHCFYQGHAAEIPNSVVTLSTCSGLRGLLQLEDVSYRIEPLVSSATYEHIVYQIKDNKIDFSPIAENYSTTQLTDKSYKIFVKSEKNSDVLQKRGLKMQIIMDKALIYSPLKVSVMLTSLEIWSDLNKISTDGDAHEVLQRFVSWREKFLFQKPHDMAYLLIYRDNRNYVGATYHGMACDPKFAAGLALVCNTLEHCHCDVEYAPSRCETSDSSPGGSIDNGFRLLEGKIAHSLIKQHGASRKNGLRISFYVFLPFLILLAIIAIKQNKLKIFQNKEDTVSEESLSEDSSSKSNQS